MLNKPSKICPRLLKLFQSGDISPNLVTLDTKGIDLYWLLCIEFRLFVYLTKL